MLTTKSVLGRYWPPQKTLPPKTNSRRFLITAPIGLRWYNSTPKKYICNVGFMPDKGLLLAHCAPPRQDKELDKYKHEDICKEYLEKVNIKWMGKAKVYIGKDPSTIKRVSQLDYITSPYSMAQKFINKIAERRYKVNIYYLSQYLHTWIDINSPLPQNLSVQSEESHNEE